MFIFHFNDWSITRELPMHRRLEQRAGGVAGPGGGAADAARCGAYESGESAAPGAGNRYAGRIIPDSPTDHGKTMGNFMGISWENPLEMIRNGGFSWKTGWCYWG